MSEITAKAPSRRKRRKIHNREALIAAGYSVISKKGIDTATMGEITELADVASGTVYNYFASKDELVIAVMERVMHRLAERIEVVTNSFKEPAKAFAFGVRSVLCATIEDPRWRGLLNRSEVISDAMYRVMGPFATRDLRAGRHPTASPELTWRMATHAITGFGLAVSRGLIEADSLEEAVIVVLGMAGVARDKAVKLAKGPWPELPPE
jgi:AcrR family transcriptional regulator